MTRKAAGELLKAIEAKSGGDRRSADFKMGGGSPFESPRQQAGRQAGMSQDQVKQAIRVANVPPFPAPSAGRGRFFSRRGEE
jgi:hypothetical protein